MQEKKGLTSHTLMTFVNKYRADLRAMPLSKELYKFILMKKEILIDDMYEITQYLLRAEKNASKQKNVFKHIDTELHIPYQKAKALAEAGKLSQATFKELFNSQTPNRPPSLDDAPKK